MKPEIEYLNVHPTGRSLKIRIFAALSVLVCLCFACALFPTERNAFAAPAKDAGPLNTKRFEGLWVRPDGGYLLDIRDVGNDGTVKAAYYNPRPIKVGRAELRKKNGTAVLVVELRDINYPGSTYTLLYNPADDRLQGKYYQAVEKQTYEIEFVRYR